MQHIPSLTGKKIPFILKLNSDNHFLIIEWSNGMSSKFPFIFLQDNALGSRHVNGQKIIETSNLEINRCPEKISFSGDESISIKWEGKEQESIFPVKWLLENDLSGNPMARLTNEQLASYCRNSWDQHLNNQLPESVFSQINVNDKALAEWLNYVRMYGFAILRDVPIAEGMVLEIIKLFGYARETNYGKLFNVKTTVNPNNLAFTSLGISAHSDNPYRNPTPGLQLLHCLSSNTNGGDSILADGFKVAEDLRKYNPDYFNLLSSVRVTFQFRDEDNWLEHSSPVISLYPDGTVEAIRFNNRSIQPFRLHPDDLLTFYEAYIYFAKMLNDEHYQVRFKMSPGDLYIVDNERVMHARSAYDDKDGERWLQGAYADRDGLLSKWRVLNLKTN